MVIAPPLLVINEPLQHDQLVLPLLGQPGKGGEFTRALLSQNFFRPFIDQLLDKLQIFQLRMGHVLAHAISGYDLAHML
ncbi:hypothetical protein LHA01_07380 [Schleiferilactobacillus harbinensis]|nr:hypothetical protein LHA01_07380 [Schleiferilactobacillus harbinensis]